jgi:hypothetical protein
MTNADPRLGKLRPVQIAALIVLMAEAREISNGELQDLVGFTLTGRDRVGLVDLKLIESRKLDRSFAHQLTEDGWRTCKNLAEAGAPVRGNTLGRALYVLLAELQQALERARLSHAEFFTAEQVEDIEGVDPVAADVLDSRIRSAYHSLAKEPEGWVGLADLRPALGAVDRAEVDAALRKLSRVPGVRLHPLANFKSLTVADREAAVRIGDEDIHALAIEDK